MFFSFFIIIIFLIYPLKDFLVQLRFLWNAAPEEMFV